tara:strand:+ start:2350 stop:3408 length:1059 start_codon:yes stop_codon:yes gene_type:complete
MILKIIFSLAASIIRFFVIFFFINSSTIAEEEIRYYSNDHGVVSIMYHRFDENKYPSTNIKIDIFKKQLELIKEYNIEYYNPANFDKEYYIPKKNHKILITIDDAFLSFYENAWPILKKNKIPFILFVSTEPVGKPGYMNWEQIKEVSSYDFAYIGNHSHTHEYLLNFSNIEFENDIKNSIKIFKEKLGYNPIFFSYPFGEYNLKQTKFIKNNFKYGFGQHSGVIDLTKNRFELPRFPINEKYGDLERFEFILKLFPIPYKDLNPKDKFVSKKQNPPTVEINFFDEQKNIKNINCFSNEGNEWRNPIMKFKKNTLEINFREKFTFRRGRVNCSVKDGDIWRWLGIQMSVEVD